METDIPGTVGPLLGSSDKEPAPAIKTDMPGTVGPLLGSKEAVTEEKQPQSKSAMGLLDNNADGSNWVPKAAATAGLKALSHVPGAVGDLRDITNLGLSAAEAGGRTALHWLGAPVEDKSTADIMQRNQKVMESSPGAFMGIGSAPSGQDIYNGLVAPTLGEYHGETGLGRAAMAGAEAMLTPMPTGKGKLLTGMAKYALPNFIGGAGAESIGEWTQNPTVGALAGVIAGAGAGKLAGTAETVATRRLTAAGREKTANELAGKIQRDATGATLDANGNVIDPSGAHTNLSESNPALPGYSPTGTGKANTPGMSGLDARLKTIDEKTPGSAANNAVDAQNDQNKAAVQSAASDANQVAHQAGVLGADIGVGNNTAGAASRAASTIVDQAREASKAVETQKWDAWRQAGGKVYTNKIIGQLQDLYENNTKPSDQPLIKGAIDNAIADMRYAQEGKVSDVEALQGIRSRILADARDAGRKGDGVTQNKLNDLAKSFTDMMTDKSNFRFGDRNQTIQLWQEARDATLDHHQTWDTQSLKRQGAVDTAGQPKLDPNDVLTDTFKGKNKALKTQQMIAASGNDADLISNMSDWHMLAMTEQNSKTPNAQRINKYLADNKEVIDQIPGLEDRITKYRDMSQADRLMEGFTKASNDPAALVRFMENNRQEMTELGNKTNQTQFFNDMEKAARQLDVKTGGKPLNEATLKSIMEGRLSTIMYGSLVPRIADGTAAAIAASMLGHHLGLPAEAAAAAAGVAGGAGHNLVHRLVHGPMEKMLTGDIKQRTIELLQKARTDPEFRKQLMETASPEKFNLFYGDLPAIQALRTAADQERAREGDQENDIIVHPPKRN